MSESGCAWPLPVFEWCSADTIMVVAVCGPVTNDCVVAVGTSVPCGVVITNPAKRKRNTITACVMHCLDNLQSLDKNKTYRQNPSYGMSTSNRTITKKRMRFSVIRLSHIKIITLGQIKQGRAVLINWIDFYDALVMYMYFHVIRKFVKRPAFLSYSQHCHVILSLGDSRPFVDANIFRSGLGLGYLDLCSWL